MKLLLLSLLLSAIFAGHTPQQCDLAPIVVPDKEKLATWRVWHDSLFREDHKRMIADKERADRQEIAALKIRLLRQGARKQEVEERIEALRKKLDDEKQNLFLLLKFEEDRRMGEFFRDYGV